MKPCNNRFLLPYKSQEKNGTKKYAACYILHLNPTLKNWGQSVQDQSYTALGKP